MNVYRQIVAAIALFTISITGYPQFVQREKIYLHFDKAYYLPGETCWFKAYIVNASDLSPTASSGIVYVDWIDPDGKILQHDKLKIYEGEANGDFSFDNKTPAGQYHLRAYTNMLRNFDQDFFFSKSFMVYNNASLLPEATSAPVSREIDLQFFPEGGMAVDGLQSQIAFKAIDASGSSVDVNGKIINEAGAEVALFRSTHKGMGVFPYVPSASQKYRVVLDNGQAFDLPKAATSGVVMSVNNMHPEKIFVQVQASNTNSLSDFTLVGHTGNQFVFSKPIEANRDRASIEISRKELRAGILQLSLYDREKVPRAERIVFIDTKKLMHIRIDRDSLFRKDDSVSFVIHTKDDSGMPVETFLSLAVADADYVTEDTLADNISTNFLFQSDIKGKIEDPGWYFQKNESRNIYALDLVMLTHGWRRFDSLTTLKFKPEQTLALKGKVVTKGGRKPIANASLTLMLAGIDYSGVHVAQCDNSGLFTIDSVDYSDSTDMVWQIRNEKGKLVDADIIFTDSNDIPEVRFLPGEAILRSNSVRSEPEIVKAIRDFSTLGKVEMLKEVEVVGGRTRSVSIGADRTLIRPGREDYRLFGASFVSRYAPVLPFMVNKVDRDGNSVWRLPSGAGIRFVINGYPMDEEFGSTGNPYLILNSYRTDQIDYLVVAGSARKGYTFIIRTKNPPSTPTPGIVKKNVPGYQWTRTFYDPRFEDPTANTGRRTTIFWEPYLATDADGRAVVRLATQDATKKLIISAEGISQGSPGALTTAVSVQ